jgi:hypothetical protein
MTTGDHRRQLRAKALVKLAAMDPAKRDRFLQLERLRRGLAPAPTLSTQTAADPSKVDPLPQPEDKRYEPEPERIHTAGKPPLGTYRPLQPYSTDAATEELHGPPRPLLLALHSVEARTPSLPAPKAGHSRSGWVIASLIAVAVVTSIALSRPSESVRLQSEIAAREANIRHWRAELVRNRNECVGDRIEFPNVPEVAIMCEKARADMERWTVGEIAREQSAIAALETRLDQLREFPAR